MLFLRVCSGVLLFLFRGSVCWSVEELTGVCRCKMLCFFLAGLSRVYWGRVVHCGRE